MFFERFFSRYEHDLSDADVGALTRLLDLSDNDLMDLLLARKEPDGDSLPDMIRVLELLRRLCAQVVSRVMQLARTRLILRLRMSMTPSDI